MDFKVKGLRGLFGQEQPYGSSRASVGRAIGAGVFQNALNPNGNNPRIRVNISTDTNPEKVKSTLEKSDSSKVSDSSTATKAASKVTTQSIEVSKKLDALSALKQIVDSANALTTELKNGVAGERSTKIKSELSTLQGAYKDVLVDSAGEGAVDTTSLVSNPMYGSLTSESASLVVDIAALQASLDAKNTISGGLSGAFEDAKYASLSLSATSSWLNPASGDPDPIADAWATMDPYGGIGGVSGSMTSLSIDLEPMVAAWSSYELYDSAIWNEFWSTTAYDAMSAQTSDLMSSSEYYEAQGDTYAASTYADSAAAVYTQYMDASYQHNVVPLESIAAKSNALNDLSNMINTYLSLTSLQAAIPQMLADQTAVVASISSSLGAIDSDISNFQVSLTLKQNTLAVVQSSLSSTNETTLVGEVASAFDNVSMINLQVNNSAGAENAISSLQNISEAVNAQIRTNEYELSSLQASENSSSSSINLDDSVVGGIGKTNEPQLADEFRRAQELTKSIGQQLLADPVLGKAAVGNLRPEMVQSLLNPDVFADKHSQTGVAHRIILDQKA